MRHAFGKPLGTCARVNINQILISVRCKESAVPHVVEALRRAKFKFPGRQELQVSRKFGFTQFTREEYLKLKNEGRIIPDGCYCKVLNDRGPLKL